MRTCGWERKGPMDGSGGGRGWKFEEEEVSFGRAERRARAIDGGIWAYGRRVQSLGVSCALAAGREALSCVLLTIARPLAMAMGSDVRHWSGSASAAPLAVGHS